MLHLVALGNSRPGPSARDLGDGRKLFDGNLGYGVGIGLDVVLTTSPRPSGRPLQATAGETVDSGALATRGGSVFSPEVVVDDVGAGGY